MNWLKGALTELIGLFVDDGSLVMAVIAWALAGVVCRHAGLLDPAWEAALLAVGVAALLAENVVRSARALAPDVRKDEPGG